MTTHHRKPTRTKSSLALKMALKGPSRDWDGARAGQGGAIPRVETPAIRLTRYQPALGRTGRERGETEAAEERRRREMCGAGADSQASAVIVSQQYSWPPMVSAHMCDPAPFTLRAADGNDTRPGVTRLGTVDPSPRVPSELSPQQNTCPLISRPQEVSAPAAMETKRWPPTTGLGAVVWEPRLEAPDRPAPPCDSTPAVALAVRSHAAGVGCRR